MEFPKVSRHQPDLADVLSVTELWSSVLPHLGSGFSGAARVGCSAKV
jgi:hypothetical protein